MMIWPAEYIRTPIERWLKRRRYAPPMRDGVPVHFDRVPLLVTLLLKDTGIQPPNIPYDLWVKRLNAAWNRDQTQKYHCREIMTEWWEGDPAGNEPAEIK